MQIQLNSNTLITPCRRLETAWLLTSMSRFPITRTSSITDVELGYIIANKEQENTTVRESILIEARFPTANVVRGSSVKVQAISTFVFWKSLSYGYV